MATSTTFTASSENQRFGNVLGAEFSRIFGRTGVKVALGVCAVLGILSSSVALVALKMLTQATQSDTLTASATNIYSTVSGGIEMTAFCLALYFIAAVSKEFNDGSMRCGLLLVPNRTRLLVARTAVWVILGVAASLIVGIIAAGTSMALGAPEMDAGKLLAQFAISTVGAVCELAVGVAIGFIFKSSAVGIILFLCITQVVGMICSGIMMAAPEPFLTIVTIINNVMLGHGTAGLAVEPVFTDATANLTLVVIWGVLAMLLSMLSFKKWNK